MGGAPLAIREDESGSCPQRVAKQLWVGLDDSYQPFEWLPVIMSTSSDAELVEQCLRGDRQAFETLVTRYEKPIFNAAYRIVGNYDDACDITQQVFVNSYESLHRFQKEYKFFSWIYRIAVNLALDHIKAVRKRQALPPISKTAVKNPEEEFFESDTSNKVQCALQQLKPELRAVLVLRHFHGLSYQEMSNILRIPQKTVKSRLYTARQQLAPLLRKAGLVANE